METNHGYKSSEPFLPRQAVVTMPTAIELVGDRPLPKDFDWRNVDGQNFVTADLNQHQPKYCGSCWVHGTTSALNDRIKIMRKGRFPDVILSRQSLMNCVPDPEGTGPPPGCGGGDPWMIHKFMHEQKVPDETCNSYTAVNQECTPLNVCRNCFRKLPVDPNDPFAPGPCWGMPTFIGYGVSDYGSIEAKNEVAMMKEIYARGPIACSGVTTVAFVQSFAQNPGVLKDGVFRDPTKYNESDIDHIMEISGWGQTADGTKYWVVRNSWGTYWGVAGWFKLERGVNSLKIEEHCDWAVPDFEELDRDLLHEVQGDYYLGVPGGTRNSFPPNSTLRLRALDDSSLVENLLQANEQLQGDSVAMSVNPVASGLVGALVGGFIMWTVPRCLVQRATVGQPLILG